MDAVYFQLGALIQAGHASGVDRGLSEADRLDLDRIVRGVPTRPAVQISSRIGRPS
jgi:hypothetical protein